MLNSNTKACRSAWVWSPQVPTSSESWPRPNFHGLFACQSRCRLTEFVKILATVLEKLATVSEKILHGRSRRTVWRGERRFMSCQLEPGTDRYPSECPRRERKDWGCKENLADRQMSASGVDTASDGFGSPRLRRRFGAIRSPEARPAAPWYDCRGWRKSN